MKHDKVRKCGKDSLVPVIMAMDSLAAGSDTTGIIHNIFCLNLLNLLIYFLRKHLRLFALSPCGEPRQTESII